MPQECLKVPLNALLLWKKNTVHHVLRAEMKRITEVSVSIQKLCKTRESKELHITRSVHDIPQDRRISAAIEEPGFRGLT